MILPQFPCQAHSEKHGQCEWAPLGWYQFLLVLFQRNSSHCTRCFLQNLPWGLGNRSPQGTAMPVPTEGWRAKDFLHMRSLNIEGISPCSLLRALRVTSVHGAGWRKSPCTRNVADPGAKGAPGSCMHEIMGRPSDGIHQLLTPRPCRRASEMQIPVPCTPSTKKPSESYPAVLSPSQFFHFLGPYLFTVGESEKWIQG